MSGVRQNWYDWRGLPYFLYEYEIKRQTDDPLPPIVPWDEIGARTVEHVLPQMANDPYWTLHFPRKPTRDRYLNHLGNLTLSGAGDNTAYANDSFPSKRGGPGQATTCYANSNFRITRDLAQLVDWTRDEINGRRDTLVSWAKQRWEIPTELLDEESYYSSDEEEEELDELDEGMDEEG